MSSRLAWFIGSIIVVCVLALAGTGFVVVATHGASGTSGAAQTPASQNKSVSGVAQVYLVNHTFTPARIQVAMGTTVTWTNRDTVPHNVTLSPAVITSSGNWESGLLYPGQSFTYTFTSRGTFQYYCQEHPGMIGAVLVT